MYKLHCRSLTVWTRLDGGDVSTRSWSANLSQILVILVVTRLLLSHLLLLLLDGWTKWLGGRAPENILKDVFSCAGTWVKQLGWQVWMVLGRNLGGGFQWETPMGEIYDDA